MKIDALDMKSTFVVNNFFSFVCNFVVSVCLLTSCRVNKAVEHHGLLIGDAQNLPGELFPTLVFCLLLAIITLRTMLVLSWGEWQLVSYVFIWCLINLFRFC